MTKRKKSPPIQLLRLELRAPPDSLCEWIGFVWSPAQPTESLSPRRAAEILGVEEWAQSSEVKKRYRKLQLRFPPDQFPEKHMQLRPAYELLADPTARLDWYWKSGSTPEYSASSEAREDLLWDADSVKERPTVSKILQNATRHY